MTNNLIPYSFIPGTKAKAQEVNANFIAAFDYVDTVGNTKMNKDLSNITSEGINIIKNSVPNGRTLGEIIASTIPLTDAGLHLLDGALLEGDGIYSDFVDFIADLYNENSTAEYFCTEAQWQTSVSTYGICGKFVYDITNNTVRLPKYSNKIYTSKLESTAPVKGSGLGLGLTDGTNNFGFIDNFSDTWNQIMFAKGNFGKTVGSALSGSVMAASNNNKTVGITTDASKSGLITELDNITTPLEIYYYIVVATSTKTDIQVDIDGIATDLNGKADADLTNISSSCKPIDGQWILDRHFLAQSTTYSAEQIVSYDLSSILPDDGCDYECLFTGWWRTGGSSGNVVGCHLYSGTGIGASSKISAYVGRARNVNGWEAICSGNCILPIEANDKVLTYYNEDGVGTSGDCGLYISAYRRIGTNQ